MPKNPRVYELARELGLTNEETLDLCDALGIGVKSHSSSVQVAQADRVRRKAEREGLIREVQPPDLDEEQTAAPAKNKKKAVAIKKAAVPKKAAVTKKAPPKKKAPAIEPAAVTKPPAATTPPNEAEAEASAPSEAEAPAPPAPQAPPPPARPLVTSSGQEPARRTVEETPARATLRPKKHRLLGKKHRLLGKKHPRIEISDQRQPRHRPECPHPLAQLAVNPFPPHLVPHPARVLGRQSRHLLAPRALGRRETSVRQAGNAREGDPPVVLVVLVVPVVLVVLVVPVVVPVVPVVVLVVPVVVLVVVLAVLAEALNSRPGGPRGGPQQRRGRKQKRRRRQREELQPQELATYTPVDAPVPEGEVVIERGSTAQELAGNLNRSAADVVRFLLQQGEMVTATQSLSDDMVELFAAELGAQIRIVDPGAEQEEEILKVLDIDLEALGSAPRPPVITVMGHVDHGKTLLLDRIRSSNVVDGEAGGITQHIGAYQVERNGQALTFIDTPGHAAFTSMRARGAQATDIVILVVAADDGVMPQTLEAMDHARAAEVPIVVAINKMDREGADPNRVLAQLAERDLIPESYGGDVITVPVSAMTEDGIDELLDQIVLVAELEELRAAPDGRAIGTVLEANLDRGRGPVATVLVQQGLLSVGDPMVAGAAWGRVRAMTDDLGNTIKEAGPSVPVEVLGLSEVPRSGDMFTVAPDEKTASRVADTREHWQRQASMASASSSGAGGAKLEDIFKQIRAGEAATLNLVLKADVHGSLEAVTDSLRKLEREEVKLSFVSRGVGGVNENDVQLAIASNATIIGFNVRPDRKAREAAEREDVEIRLYEIIYQLLDDIENAMLGMLEPEFEEIVTGEAQVREVFRISRVGPVAGCFVEHGTIRDGAKVRFLREGTIIWKGEVASLRHFQDSVPQVNAGMECGIGLSDFTDLKEGDVIETYDEREIPRV